MALNCNFTTNAFVGRRARRAVGGGRRALADRSGRPTSANTILRLRPSMWKQLISINAILGVRRGARATCWCWTRAASRRPAAVARRAQAAMARRPTALPISPNVSWRDPKYSNYILNDFNTKITWFTILNNNMCIIIFFITNIKPHSPLCIYTYIVR